MNTHEQYTYFKCIMATIYSSDLEESLQEIDVSFLLGNFTDLLKNILEDENTHYLIDSYAKNNIFKLVQYILSNYKVEEQYVEAFYERYNELIILANQVKMDPKKFYKEQILTRFGYHSLFPIVDYENINKEILYNCINLDYQIIKSLALSEEDYLEVAKELSNNEEYIGTVLTLIQEVPEIFTNKEIRRRLLIPLESNQKKYDSGYHLDIEYSAIKVSKKLVKAIKTIDQENNE